MRRERMKESLADLLVRRCSIEGPQLDEARTLAESTGRRLELVLADEEYVSEQQLALATADYLGMPVLSLAHFTPDDHLLTQLPMNLIAALQVLPVGTWNNTLAVAMADPFNMVAIEELRTLTNRTIEPFVAPRTEVAHLLQQSCYEPTESLADVLRDVNTVTADVVAAEEEAVDSDELVTSAAQEPVIRVVNTILVEAMNQRASDVHLDPLKGQLLVRYRIDGVLYDRPSPPQHMQQAIISRIKIISRLNVAERRLPQDGRFAIRTSGRNVDVRVSMVPTVTGEKVVLRILDQKNLRPNISSLGLAPDDFDKLNKAIHQPHGLLIVSGPTGSGKTTTLYSVLQELSDPKLNIITIENPVEYRLPRINQIQTKPEIGMGFHEGLRAVLRQDPDVIMVGEIRDPETASIAVQASMTEHLVLSTLHSNEAAGAVARMVHMGIEPFLLASSLLLSQAQRIYRKLCPTCKRLTPYSAQTLAHLGASPDMLGDAVPYSAVGCYQCDSIGYHGRDVIMEILVADDDMRELIAERATAAQIREHAMAAGMVSLHEAGMLRVRNGETSIEEILRVTSHG